MNESVEFLDALLRALGLSSVITRTSAPEDEPSMTQTGIYGRSHFSVENREELRLALEREPQPRTLGQLCDAVRIQADSGGGRHAAALLPAVQRASEPQPELPLTDFVEAYRKQQGG